MQKIVAYFKFIFTNGHKIIGGGIWNTINDFPPFYKLLLTKWL